MENKKPKIIHRKKLFDGKETAQEVHRRYAWQPGARCAKCGDRDVVIQISSHMPTKELINNHPEVAGRVMAASEDGMTIPSWPSKYGRMTQVGIAYACETHRAEAERVAARAPSSVLIEIDRGVGKDITVVQVPRGAES